MTERGAGHGRCSRVREHGHGQPGTSAKCGWLPLVFQPGTVIYADSSAGSTGPQLLYQAIGAGNLRALTDGTDAVGHAALSN
jgi:hypothetical protein